MGVLPFLLVSTVKTIIAQRLVRRLSSVKEKYFLSDVDKKSLANVANLDLVLLALKEEKIIEGGTTWDKIPFFKNIKSEDCPEGYSGRIGIHEVMKVTPAIKDLISKGASQDEIEKTARESGMMTMVEDGIFQAVRGFTTIEEVFRVVSE